MVIGFCRLRLRLPENQSLKGKRAVVKSLVARLQNRFKVSAAETADNDSWQIATIGAACVSNDERHATQVIASVVSFVRNERLDAELLDVETEIIDGFD